MGGGIGGEVGCSGVATFGYEIVSCVEGWRYILLATAYYCDSSQLTYGGSGEYSGFVWDLLSRTFVEFVQ